MHLLMMINWIYEFDEINSNSAFFSATIGYRRLYQERIRQEIQSNMALHCGPQFWFLRDPRNQAFHLFLSWTSCDTFV